MNKKITAITFFTLQGFVKIFRNYMTLLMQASNISHGACIYS